MAAASFGIVISRMKAEVKPADVALAGMFLLEVVGSVLITRSRLGLMRAAFWIFVLRILCAFGYMGVVHGDKLARSTFGFPLAVLIYCWARVRALKERP